MRRRSGFTITELLVAMALIVFIMSIIASAFTEGMKTFRSLKAIGDMNQRLRTASSLLKDDLSALHFGDDRRLSDANFWTIGPPREGFFRVWQGSALPAGINTSTPYINEGTDVATDYGIQSVRATDHILHFTSRKLGNDPSKFYRAVVPANSALGALTPSGTTIPPNFAYGSTNSRFQDAGTFTSQWAEIAWFLRPNGQTANGTPLYTLYRKQRVVVPNPMIGNGQTGNLADGTNLNFNVPSLSPYATKGATPSVYNNLATGSNYLGVSCRPGANGQLMFNSPSDLTVPQYRFSMQRNVYGGLPAQSYASAFTNAAGNPIVVPTYFINQPNGTGDATEEQSALNNNLQGADAVITDVISFAVRFRVATATGLFVDVASTNLASSATAGNPLFNKATGPFVFDTWSSLVDDQVDYSLWGLTSATTGITFTPPDLPNRRVPNRSIVTAIQIQLRVWENKTDQTRQMTIVVDM